MARRRQDKAVKKETAPFAVLFDLDGVLIETERETFAFYQDYLKRRYDIILPEGAFRYKIGRKSADFWRDALTPLERKVVNVEKLTLLKRKLFMTHPQRYVKKVAGAKRLLQSLQRSRYKLALTTQNEEQMMRSVFRWLGIRDYFDIALSPEDISHNKPHPEIYRRAARMLHVTAENCVVIEDSYDGILAAKRAKMTCVAIEHPYSPPGNAVHADFSVASLLDIHVPLIQRLLTGRKPRS